MACMGTTGVLDDTHRETWERDGFSLIRNFADPELCRDLHLAAIDLARAERDVRGSVDGTVVVPEGHPGADASEPEDFVAKIFKLHRREPFDRFALDPRLLAIATALLGDDVDLFLSQFIFKGPEAYGQPWHQDSFYFPFSSSHQLGAWLAVTRATTRNGCLWVVPGTHREPIHEHVPDDRPNATRAYTRIVDHDMSAAIAVEMSPGDLLLFDSHVMHSSTDNASAELRASLVVHYSRAGVDDHSPDSTVNDWMPVVRGGEPVER